MEGTIVKVCQSFGFIEPYGKGEALFFHRNDLDASLEFCELLMMRRITYDIAMDWRTGKEHATNVRECGR